MKTCACCGAIADAAEPTCPMCGEASWIECADDRGAAGDEPAPSQPKKRGR